MRFGVTKTEGDAAELAGARINQATCKLSSSCRLSSHFQIVARTESLLGPLHDSAVRILLLIKKRSNRKCRGFDIAAGNSLTLDFRNHSFRSLRVLGGSFTRCRLIRDDAEEQCCSIRNDLLSRRCGD